MTAPRTRAASLLLGALLAPVWLGAAPLRDIRVVFRGTALESPDYVLAYTSVRPGDEADGRRISGDIKALLATGRFSFVDAELTPVPGASAFDLAFIVEPRPRLEAPVRVDGAEVMGADKVRQWLELQPGDTVDDAILSVQVRKVLQEYRQRYYTDAAATWALQVNPSNGFAGVVLTVREGPRASLRRVRFTGNTYEPPGVWSRLGAGLRHERALGPRSVPPEDLRAALKPRLWHLWSGFTKRGVYDPEALDSDRALLRMLYQNRGHLDAVVGEPAVQAFAPGKLEATFPIEEGPQYRIGTWTLRGATQAPESELRALVALAPGALAAMDRIQQSADALRDYYQSRGYLRTTVRPVLNTRLDEPLVDIVFDITESRRMSIRHIDIRGNTRTRDKVIRRELLVYPGEVFDQVRIRRSENILRNLGFFDTVSSAPRETLDPACDDLVFEVAEKRTGQFMVGAGFSSVDDLMGYAELSQGNFDLLGWPHFTGAGQKLRLRIQAGSERQDYELSFVEPWFLDRKLSLGADLYDRTRNNLSDYYNEERLGGALTLGKPIPGFFQRANLQYRLEQIDIYDMSTNAAPSLRRDAGIWNQSTLKLSLVRDTRDQPFVPTRGTKFSVSGRVSGGPLGFDVDVYGFDAELLTYIPLVFNHVLSLRGWAETVEEFGDDDTVHVFDRLFLGGPRTLRGFKYRYVAPYEEGMPIGGRTAALGSVEYTIPLYKNLLRAAGFYDIGNVWLEPADVDLLDYCSDIGVGLRLDIPGFPIRVDYAWPLEISGPDIERTSGRFNFWLGYGF